MKIIKNFVWAFLYVFGACGIFMAFQILFSTFVMAQDMVELQELSVNYKSFFDGARDPLITGNGLGNSLDKELNVHMNLDILKYGYFNNMIHSQMDRDVNDYKQYRLVGWNYQIGIYVNEYINVEYEHYSQHLLDYQYPYSGYPEQDSIGFKVYLYKKQPSNKGIF